MKTMTITPKNPDDGFFLYKTLIKVRFLLQDDGSAKALYFDKEVGKLVNKFATTSNKMVEISGGLNFWVNMGASMHFLIEQTLDSKDSERYLLLAKYANITHTIVSGMTKTFNETDFTLYMKKSCI